MTWASWQLAGVGVLGPAAVGVLFLLAAATSGHPGGVVIAVVLATLLGMAVLVGLVPVGLLYFPRTRIAGAVIAFLLGLGLLLAGLSLLRHDTGPGLPVLAEAGLMLWSGTRGVRGQ